MGPRSKFLGTNLDSFEANWILVLDPTLHLCLHLCSSNNELSFKFFLWVWTNWFPKWCHVSLVQFATFWLWPSYKDYSSNLWLSSSNRIVLFHWTLDIGPSSKVAFNFTKSWYERLCYFYWIFCVIKSPLFFILCWNGLRDFILNCKSHLWFLKNKLYSFITNHDYIKVIFNFIKIVIMQFFLLMSPPFDVIFSISNDTLSNHEDFFNLLKNKYLLS